MFKFIKKLFSPTVSEPKERFHPNFRWTIFSRFARQILRGKTEFKITLDDFTLIQDLQKYLGKDFYSEHRLSYRPVEGKLSKSGPKANPLGGIEELKIGINPSNAEAMMFVKMRRKK